MELLDLNLDFWKKMSNDIFTVLHVHGDDVELTEAINRFPSSAINWHDFDGPSIEKASKFFRGGLLGGINQNALVQGDFNLDITHLHQLKNSLPFILSPGCVLLQGTDLSNLEENLQKYRN